MYIVGGFESYAYRSQISIVEDCGLHRVGTLPLRFQYGACNTFSDIALLCFSSSGMNECHM